MNQNIKELELRISHIKNSQRSQHREIKMAIEEIYKILKLLIAKQNPTETILNLQPEISKTSVNDQIKELLAKNKSDDKNNEN